MMCINRDKSPATCCCGCSLECGIITVAVLHAINLCAEIFALNWWGVLFACAFLIPICCLAIWKESKPLRFINFLIQAIILGAAVIGIIIFVIAIEGFDLPEKFCGVATLGDLGDDFGAQLATNSCVKAVKMWLYIVFGALVVIYLPLQWLFMSIFKAYHDELKEDGSGGYSQLPADEEAA